MDAQKDISELLDAITWGRRIVEVLNGKNELVTYVIRPLTLEEKNMGNYIHKKALREAVDDGLLTKEANIAQAIHQGLWKSAYDDDLKSLRNELSKQSEDRDKEWRSSMVDSSGKRKRQSPTTLLKKIDARIAKISETIQKLELDYAQHIELPSADYRAECERGCYFVCCATLTFPDMRAAWSSFRELKLERDTILVNNLMCAYYKESVAEESEIRRIARSGFWRCKWVASKKNRGVKTLFNREMFDLTLDQFRLVYWSQVYDSAFESLESPSDSVVEDDKLFDKWLEEQHKKREQERKKSAFDKKVNKLNKGRDAHELSVSILGEFSEECTCGVKEEAMMRGNDKRGHLHSPSCPHGVFIYYNDETKRKKIEDIQSTNADSIRKILGNEQKRLADAGVDGIEEQNLRGDKVRQAFGMGTKWHGDGDPGNKQGRVRSPRR